MAAPRLIVNLLILTSQGDEAQGFIKALRNGGLPVHGTFLGRLDELNEVVGSQTFDLILCCEYDSAIDWGAWIAHYRELELDVPLVVITDRTDPEFIVTVARDGARGIVWRNNTEQLQLVVTRELDDLENRRSMIRIRDRLEECEQRAKGVIDASGEAVAFLQEGVHVQVNPAYQQLFGLEADDFDGFPLLDVVSPEQQGEVKQSLRLLNRLKEDESETLDIKCVRADGTPFDAELTFSKTTLDGDPCLRITARAHGLAGVGGSPLVDPETGFPNRAALTDELAARLDPSSDGKMVAVLYVGLKDYSDVLQQTGWDSAVEAATGFGKALRELIPEDAYLARAADDGFVVLAEDMRRSAAIELAAKIKHEAQLPNVAPKLATCATGIMLAEAGTTRPQDVLNAVYRDYVLGTLGAVEQKGAAVAAGEASHDQPTEEERRMLSLIDEALAGDGFELHYQPIVSLKGDSHENYSVLLRLRDENEHLLEAKDFLPLAVRSERMLAIDRWVIQNAISVVAAKRAEHAKVNFFLNLSADALQEEEILLWICDCLRDYKARGNWLTFQIDEDHARRHAAIFSSLNEGLKKVKCRVALNRFGSGPNPEFVLKNLQPDFVKFMPALGNRLADDGAKQKQLMAMAELAREADVRTVVTGVEDARSLTVLWTAGIDYVQGYFLQRPSPNIETKEIEE